MEPQLMARPTTIVGTAVAVLGLAVRVCRLFPEPALSAPAGT
jgi:hypothetical protein